MHLKENNTGIQDVETPKHFGRRSTQAKNTTKSAALDTTISQHEWHEYFNSLANSPLYPSIHAVRDQMQPHMIRK